MTGFLDALARSIGYLTLGGGTLVIAYILFHGLMDHFIKNNEEILGIGYEVDQLRTQVNNAVKNTLNKRKRKA